MKILIMGCRSFASTGLESVLRLDNHDVFMFTRGEENRIDNFITGDVFSLKNNAFFDEKYDIIINFIIIKNNSIESNLDYIKELLKFAINKNVQKIIQISSISVYPIHLNNINEHTIIEKNINNKGEYAAIKIAVDVFLQEKDISNNLKIEFVRPGFIICEDVKPSMAGIFIPILLKWGLLMGNKKSTLPTIKKKILHNAIVKIISNNVDGSVYLLTSNQGTSKYDFVKKYTNYKVVVLPKTLTLFVAKTLGVLRLFNKVKANQVQGLFKDSKYNSKETQLILKCDFE